ncbi:MAG: response regulator [Pyrinomonadaceae bacterium]
MKILLVEDIHDSREFMKWFLEMEGNQITEAVNGKEAVEYAQTEQPDIILMDLDLPIMNGLTATRHIKQIEACESIPIIAITAYPKDLHDIAFDVGCEAVLGKPINFDELTQAINISAPQ